MKKGDALPANQGRSRWSWGVVMRGSLSREVWIMDFSDSYLWLFRLVDYKILLTFIKIIILVFLKNWKWINPASMVLLTYYPTYQLSYGSLLSSYCGRREQRYFLIICFVFCMRVAWVHEKRLISLLFTKRWRWLEDNYYHTILPTLILPGRSENLASSAAVRTSKRKMSIMSFARRFWILTLMKLFYLNTFQ